MPTDIQLEAEDADLLIELLEREQRDLPSEVRHTDHTVFRDQLRDRQRHVADLLSRLRKELAA